MSLVARLHELTFKDCKLVDRTHEDFFKSLFEQEEFNLKRITVLGTLTAAGSQLSNLSDEKAGSTAHWTTLINSSLRGNVYAKIG